MGPVPDFTGYATRHGLKCADGRIIMAGAFKANDGQRVPLLWQHGHSDPDNVLGHAILKNVEEGVRVQAFFNSTPKATTAKQLVQHKDITQLSIYANQLIQKGANVHHGNIREVSMVISGANPGALIDPVTIRHGDDMIELEDEAIITTGLEFEVALEHASASTETEGALEEGTVDETEKSVDDILHSLNPEQLDVVKMLIGEALEHSGDEELEELELELEDDETEGETVNALAHAASVTAAVPAAKTPAVPAAKAPAGGKTIADVFNELTDEQKNVVYAMIGVALDNAQHSGLEGGDNYEGDQVSRNVFDQSDKVQAPAPVGYAFSHSDVKGIMAAAVKGGSLKGAVEDFALAHGIDDIDVMFPEVKLLANEPDFMSRRMAWVNVVLSATRKSPFSRVKTILADITPDEARAKGYVKAAMKNEEFFGVTKRTTTPTTVYKKQKLDRDDILDITDFDVISWMKGEMRIMLDEEVARAILIGDGRDISHQDKIKDPSGASDGAGIRSVLNDHEIYTTTINVNVDDANSSADEIVDSLVNGMRFYRGTGNPTFFTTLPTLTKLLLAKDSLGRRLYSTQADLAAAMMVREIQTVEPMEELTDLLGIVVNLTDYNVGADSGGDVALFDFFDIDFNQQKYLIETRMSGALVKYKSAIAVKKVAASLVLVDPLIAPVQDVNAVSGANQANVTYVATGAAGPVTITSGAFTLTTGNTPVTVQATPASGYYFASNAEDSWTFVYQA
jgi:HK97 family phage prohead protease